MLTLIYSRPNRNKILPFELSVRCHWMRAVVMCGLPFCGEHG